MSSGSSCHFCASPNPAGSKFCNDCGEPLDLKPCTHCDAFNHVALARCFQCGAPFEAKQAPPAVPEPAVARVVVGPAGGGESPPAPRAPATPARPPFRVEPTLDPLERIPVALSDRMEARTERVAERAGDAPPPLMPFAEEPDSAADPDIDWVDPRQERAARRDLRVRRRARAAYGAAVALVLCAAAAAGYAAYDTGLLSPATDWARATGRTLVAASAAMIGEVRGERPDVHDEASPPPTPAGPSKSDATDTASRPDAAAASGTATTTRPGTVNASPAVTAAPAPAAPIEAPAPLATKTLGDPTAPAPASPPTPARAKSTRDRAAGTPPPESATRPSRPAHRDATRQAAREAPPGPARAASAVDKDALATQRLIERDLAGFLPHPPAEAAAPR